MGNFTKSGMEKEISSDKPSSWSETQEVGTVIGIRFLFFVYRWLGRWAFGICLFPVITYFFLFKPIQRRSSLDYLKRVRQHGAKLSAKRSLTVLSIQHFFLFGCSLLDKIAAWAGGIDRSDIDYEGRDIFLQRVAESKGMLVIVSHLGNPEVCRVLAEGNQKVNLNILVHTKHAERFNRIMHEVDPNSCLNLIQVTELTPATAVMLQEKLAEGEVVVIAGDRTPLSGGRQSSVQFFGSEAYFPQGPYILASILKCSVYLLFCAKQAGRHHLSFEPFADSLDLNRRNRDQQIADWAQRYAIRLQHYVSQYPLQWFNFYPFWKDSVVGKKH